MSKEAIKKFVENNGFICNKCGKVIVDGIKHKNEEDLCDKCKISDLEAKLAESEEKCNKQWLQIQADTEHIQKLKQQLEESEKEKQEFLIKYKHWRTECEQLKQQLEEKDLKITQLETKLNLKDKGTNV